jgi:hypothetical protein
MIILEYLSTVQVPSTWYHSREEGRRKRILLFRPRHRKFIYRSRYLTVYYSTTCYALSGAHLQHNAKEILFENAKCSNRMLKQKMHRRHCIRARASATHLASNHVLNFSLGSLLQKLMTSNRPMSRLCRPLYLDQVLSRDPYP